MTKAISTMLARFCHYARAENGNITMIMAFAFLAVVLVCGAAIDYGRLVSARTELSAAVDAAALQAGTSTITNAAQLERLARDVVARNYAEEDHGEIIDFDLVRTTSQINLTVTAAFPTTF